VEAPKVQLCKSLCRFDVKFDDYDYLEMTALILFFILLSLCGMGGIARADVADTLSITGGNHNNRIGAEPHHEDKSNGIARSKYPSLLDQYKWYVVGAFSLIAVQTGLIAGLLAERRRLRRAEEGRLQLAAIVESSSDAIIGTSLDGRILSWNLGAELMCGYTVAEVLGRDISVIVPPERMEDISEGLMKLKTGEYIENFETEWLKRDGTRIDVSLSASPIKDMGGRVIAVATIARDITERKRSEQELHRLTARLLNLQDEERRRLALELHDVTAQNLFAINMNLSRLQRGRVETSEAKEILAESRRLGHQSLQEIRTLSYLLHPPMLDQAGLVDALKWYVSGFIKRSGINVEVLTIDEIGRLPPEIEVALFRIVQESLTNIRRHSGSSSASIRLEKDKDQVILQIRDHGRGVPSKPPLWDPRPAWEGNWTWDQFIVFSWDAGERRLLIAVNYGPVQGQCYVALGLPGLAGHAFELVDLLGSDQYLRDGDGLLGNGLYLDMPPWGAQVFEMRPAEIERTAAATAPLQRKDESRRLGQRSAGAQGGAH
jgi:PAS domain S-box-containing protein